MRSRRPWVIFLIGMLLAAAAVSQSEDRKPGKPGTSAVSR